ncbi:MAG: hypothetical protein HUJ87_14870 [Fusobacterium varium]|nr:hypothetical protein [Fusobacterium varium]MCF0171774.1 hypothetical protein [Fusobacterium varium]
MENEKKCIWCQECYPVNEQKWACSSKGEYINEDDKACDLFNEVEKI